MHLPPREDSTHGPAVAVYPNDTDAMRKLEEQDELFRPFHKTRTALNVQGRMEPQAAPERVMIVDDNPVNLLLLQEMLVGRGFQVQSFTLGRQALAEAAKNPPGLILLDVNMPGMSGYEVCEYLKADRLLCEIPVIFLSARATLDDRLRGFQAGAVDYVTKPFHIDEVRARVDAHLKLRQKQQKIEGTNERLEAVVESQAKKIAEAHVETIFAVAKLAETRDDVTGRHLERVQAVCRILADGMGERMEYRDMINETWVRNIFYASPLHDIGKVGIPDQILLKPGPLTSSERCIMETHANLGANTLRTVLNRYPGNEFIAMGIDIAASHHERWDGTGYPKRLRREEIPLAARVVAVADCYDALRSCRPYKSAMPHRQACAVIQSESGRQFDPDVVNAFNRLSDEIERQWLAANSESS